MPSPSSSLDCNTATARCFSSQNEANGNSAGISPESITEGTGKLIKDDGLTLSHFITKSQQSSIKVTQTTTTATASTLESDLNNNGTDTANTISNSASSIPVAAELGDEFDDDVMVTDAMSCSNKSNSETATSGSTLDWLGHQMINGNEEESDNDDELHTLKFHIKTYGCQMNVNDTDIVRSILLNNHTSQNNNDDTSKSGSTTNSIESAVPLRFIETNDEIQADVLLTNTCAIRENAEQKVWNRLRELRSHDRNFPLSSVADNQGDGNAAATPLHKISKMTKEQRKIHQKQNGHNNKKRIIGVLGCMAERLKEDMFKDGTADVVVGPDAYRDLPRLISVLSAPSLATHDHDEVGSKTRRKGAKAIPTERAVNVQLSLDETYASITPIRSNPQDVSAFVSIMRGCNNMCSYCVVPFTRGRERSRDLESVVEETKRLLEEENVKEVILLGQNVNSYHDLRGEKQSSGKKKKVNEVDNTYQTSNDGFSNMFRLRHGDGYRFEDLLEAISDLSPELRVRFTSPHPKDYPPSLLSLMAERSNICNHLHMPAQSGSSSVLQRMRRGYTREAYLELIDDVRSLIPDVAITSDFISGFCGETEEEHQDTLSLMEKVQFDQAFMFAYSMRGKTHAHRTMEDDVLPDVKNRRLNEVINSFRRNVQLRNEEVEIGKLRLVLIEGESKRSTPENMQLSGRTDENKRVVFQSSPVLMEEEVNPILSNLISSYVLNESKGINFDSESSLQTRVRLSRGDYAVVQITEARGHTLKGQALWRSSIAGFDCLRSMNGWNEASSDIVRPILTI